MGDAPPALRRRGGRRFDVCAFWANRPVEAPTSLRGLTAYVTSTGQLIGTLSGGRLEVSWPSNPGSVTVRSWNGGAATRTVTT